MKLRLVFSAGVQMTFWTITSYQSETICPGPCLFEGVGMSPDIVIDSTVDDIRSGHEAAAARAQEFLKNPRD
jgi:hypothetical protein